MKFLGLKYQPLQILFPDDFFSMLNTFAAQQVIVVIYILVTYIERDESFFFVLCYGSVEIVTTHMALVIRQNLVVMDGS